MPLLLHLKGGMMREKERIPACPYCESNKYVVPDRTVEKIGTASGGVIGIGAAYAGCKAGAAGGAAVGAAAGAVISNLGTSLGTGLGAAGGAIVGFLAGSAAGNAVGQCVDSQIRMKYRCTKCGHVIQG
jgi:DNA-directed RNA polymerase subunit RPC12/RpoP